MAYSLFQTTIVSPSGTVYAGTVQFVVVPSEAGYAQICAHHAPFAAVLAPGTITMREESGKTQVFHTKHKGFVEAMDNSVRVILREDIEH